LCNIFIYSTAKGQKSSNVPIMKMIKRQLKSSHLKSNQNIISLSLSPSLNNFYTEENDLIHKACGRKKTFVAANSVAFSLLLIQTLLQRESRGLHQDGQLLVEAAKSLVLLPQLSVGRLQLRHSLPPIWQAARSVAS